MGSNWWSERAGRALALPVALLGLAASPGSGGNAVPYRTRPTHYGLVARLDPSLITTCGYGDQGSGVGDPVTWSWRSPTSPGPSSAYLWLYDGWQGWSPLPVADHVHHRMADRYETPQSSGAIGFKVAAVPASLQEQWVQLIADIDVLRQAAMGGTQQKAGELESLLARQPAGLRGIHPLDPASGDGPEPLYLSRWVDEASPVLRKVVEVEVTVDAEGKARFLPGHKVHHFDSAGRPTTPDVTRLEDYRFLLLSLAGVAGLAVLWLVRSRAWWRAKALARR